MGLLARLGSFFRQKTPNFANLYDLGFGKAGGLSFRRSNPTEMLRKYGESSILRSPVDRICNDVAMVKWHLYREDIGAAVTGPSGPPRTEVHQHDLLTLWNQPCPMMTGFQFRKLIQTWLECGSGEAPLLIERRPGTLKPDALWPLQASQVTKLPTVDQPWFEFSLNGVPTWAPAGEVIWLNSLDPLFPYGRGLPISASVDDQIQQSEWANKFNNQFFRQGGHPGMVISTEGPLSESKEKALEAKWQADYGGFWNSFKAAFLSGGKVQVHQLGANHKDLDFISGKKQLRDETRQAFNVPGELVGVSENSNRATAQAADYIHQRGNTAPRITYLEEAWNLWLVPLYGDPTLRLRAENSVRETEEFRLDKADRGLQGGALTVDEWRREQGYDPLPGGHGNVRYVPLNTVAVSAETGQPVQITGGETPVQMAPTYLPAPRLALPAGRQNGALQ